MGTTHTEVIYRSHRLTSAEKCKLKMMGDYDLDNLCIASLTPYGRKRQRECANKLSHALAYDAKKERQRPNNLPKYWDGRIIRS